MAIDKNAPNDLARWTAWRGNAHGLPAHLPDEDYVSAFKLADSELRRRAELRARMLVLEALHRATRNMGPDGVGDELAVASRALQLFRTLAGAESFTDDMEVWAALMRAWLIRPGAPHKAKTRRSGAGSA